MKTIGIIGAMQEEISGIRACMQIITSRTIAGLVYDIGSLKGKNTILVQSGIGKVNAALCTQVLIDHFAVDCIINIGVAGAVVPSLQLGDIVIAKDTVQHDMDTSAFGDPIGVIPRMKESFFPADPTLASLAMTAAASVLGAEKVCHGRIASGDQFIHTKEERDRIASVLQGSCAEMEGAAIAQVCWLNLVPFAIMRTISDTAAGEAKHQYETFLQTYAQKAAGIINHLFASLP